MCKVSVIMPSLNVAKYVDAAIASVRRQTLEDIEIICVDAGSTDGTLEIIRSHMEQDNRIRLIISDRKSYGYQMNLGLDMAKGEYIGIVETDDYVPAQMYAELCAVADREKAEIVKADFYRFVDAGEQIERKYNRLDPTDACYGRVIDPAKEQRVFRCIMNTWSGVYLRSFLEKHGIRHNETPGASYQDNGFWFRTFCCARRIYLVSKPYYRNRRDNAASSVKHPGKVYCMSEEWADIEAWLRADKARFETFAGVYALRKYHSLLFTYDRIAPEFRAEFIRHISAQMHALVDSGTCERRLFNRYEWTRLQQILRNPMAFHETMSASCAYLSAARCARRLSGCRPLAQAVRKLSMACNALELLCSWAEYEGLVRALHRLRWRRAIDRVDKEF